MNAKPPLLAALSLLLASAPPLSADDPPVNLRRTVTHGENGARRIALEWNTAPGFIYYSEFSATLEPGSWTAVHEFFPHEAGGEADIDFAIDPGQRLFRIQCIPADGDADGDGMPNDWETVNGLDLLDASGDNGAAGDPDRDGISNADELAQGSDPQDNAALADPDGANLPQNLNVSGDGSMLAGFWDFENVQGASCPDRSGKSRDATLLGSASVAPGMPSAGVALSGGCLKLPYAVLQGRHTFSLSMWLRLPKDSISAISGEMDVLGVMRDFDGSSGSPRIDMLWAYIKNDRKLYMESHWVNYPSKSDLGNWTLPDNFDDGAWHHLAIVQTRFENLWRRTVFADGASLGNSDSNKVLFNFQFSPGIFIGARDGDSAARPACRLRGGIDRLRVWSRELSESEILALHHQDIDRDCLWDITEARRRLWRDANSDALVQPSELTFARLDPFHWHDAANTDSDNDGRNDLPEQDGTPNPGETLPPGAPPLQPTDPANPDTDGDMLPDGWETANLLNPLDPSDGFHTDESHPDGTCPDSDSDGLDNLEEYMNGTDPNNANTDGDSAGDLEEVQQGSDPLDASDGGFAPPASEVLALRLGIGDQSGSESENYHLVCYEYDPATGAEREVFRLVSGGFGKYTEKVSRIFRKWKMYTFRIEWRGSNLNYRQESYPGAGDSEGPDFDYTMKIEPLGDEPALVLTDAYDPASGSAIPGLSLLGEKSDVADFIEISTSSRVLAAGILIDLAADIDLNEEIESAPDAWPSSATLPDSVLENTPPSRAAVIDVNNNNTDSGIASAPGKDQVDNRNDILDTEADRTENTDNARSHAFGTLRVWASPLIEYGLAWRGGADKRKYALRLSLPNQGDDQTVRVFGWRRDLPRLLLGPGKTSHEFDHEKFFEEDVFSSTNPTKWHRDLFVEGLSYGRACLRLETVRLSDGTVVASDDVFFAVNVDRIEQPPGEVATNKDALHLRGTVPHHIGARKPDVSAMPVHALRGTLALCVPPVRDGTWWWTRHTPMRGRKLKESNENSEQAKSGSSFWVGLQRHYPDGSFQWVQAGLRWVQAPNETHGSQPALYIETGDTFLDLGAKSLHQMATKDDQLGGGVLTQNIIPALSDWQSQPVKLDFVLFKPCETDDDGNEASATEVPWFAVFKNIRPGANPDDLGSYMLLSIGKPVPPGTTGYSSELVARYNAQRFRELDALFETNQSIAFAPGLADGKASVAGLSTASRLKPGHAPMPPAANTGNKKAIYDWALESYEWTARAFATANRTLEVKTGRRAANGNGENGTAPHPHWHAEIIDGALKVWDERTPDWNDTPQN